MSDHLSLNIEEYKENPRMWVELARRLAEEDVEVPETLEAELDALPKPRIEDPSSARVSFWSLLALPQRDRGIRWLDKHGLLAELIPCWGGNATRRNLRLNALEQVHLEVWKNGLSEPVFKAICDVHEVVVDRRLNRWALTALATLLAGGDTENQSSWSKAVRRDLHTLGATEAEIVWVERIVRDFNAALLFLRGGVDDFHLRPEHVVAGISTLKVTDPTVVKDAIKRADLALSGEGNHLDHPDDEGKD